MNASRSDTGRPTRGINKRQPIAIKFEIMVHAASQTVWKLLTDPALIPAWNYMGRVELDRLAPGGTFTFHSKNGAQRPDKGVILLVEPQRRLAYDWHSSEPAPTRVEYLLTQAGEYTKLEFANSGFLEGGDWSDFYAQDFRGWVQYHLSLKSAAEAASLSATAS